MFCIRRRQRSGKKLGLVFVVFIATFLLATKMLSQSEFMLEFPEVREVDTRQYVQTYPDNHWKPQAVKKILVWTPFFGKMEWVDIMQKELKKCNLSCVATSDRSQLRESNAVLFHENDLWNYKGIVVSFYQSSIDMPRHRSPDQVWVILSMEPTIYVWGSYEPDAFNWTMTYRRDSTIYMPMGDYVRKTEKEEQDTADKAPAINYAQQKTKMAATLVSNCMDDTRRYRIIRELQKYIDLDYFGKCSGNQVCEKNTSAYECGKKYLNHYKFYLAFENSICLDYLSEKFWLALDRDQIPIIATNHNISELVPPRSYLNLFDFPSAKHLAEKMIELDQNETLYNSYFAWKKHYKHNKVNDYCKLCQNLHANRPAQSYRDLDGWRKKDDTCQPSTAKSLVVRFFDRLSFDLGLS